MNDYESKKAAREDLMRVKANDIRKAGKIPNTREIESWANKKADYLDAKKERR